MPNAVFKESLNVAAAVDNADAMNHKWFVCTIFMVQTSFMGLVMNRRSFGQLFFGLPLLVPALVSEVALKREKPDLSKAIKAEQDHLVALRDWLSSSEGNPYSAAYVSGIQTLVTQSEERIKRLQSRSSVS